MSDGQPDDTQIAIGKANIEANALWECMLEGCTEDECNALTKELAETFNGVMNGHTHSTVFVSLISFIASYVIHLSEEGPLSELTSMVLFENALQRAIATTLATRQAMAEAEEHGLDS